MKNINDMSDKELDIEVIDEMIKLYVKDNFKFYFDPKNPKVKLHEPSYGAEEISAALGVMLSTNVTLGKSGHVEKFEKEFAEKYGFEYAVMVNSGSSANLLAVSVLTSPSIRKLKPGDKIIVPALCWSTTVWPLIQHGLIPIFVDININTLNINFNRIDPKFLEEASGMMVVHVYGNPCDSEFMRHFCSTYNLVLIEDCCESLGAKFHDNKSVGFYGDISTFSFYFSHHMTTFEGGMCVTNSEHMYDHLKMMRSHGWSRDILGWIQYPDLDPKFTFVDLGYNLRPTEIQGAIGLEQLKKVDNFIKIRRENSNYWLDKLSRYSEYFYMSSSNYSSTNSPFGFTCVLNKSVNFSAKEMRKFMEDKGIETRSIICGNIVKQPALESYKYISTYCVVADRVMKDGFSWGNHQHVNEEAREYVYDVICEFMESKGY